MRRHHERLKLVNKRLAELLAVELRKDLTDEEKNALISAKMDEYEQHPYASSPAGGEQTAAEFGKSHEKNTQEQEIEIRRRKFDQALKEGRIRVKPLPKE